jgi:uncharacterized protein involved in type VI secretion and phage assembly
MFNFLEGGPQVNRIYGVVVGIVIDNKHPGGEYSVKVKFPWVRESDAKYTGGTPDDEDFFSTWCRILQLMAGKQRGIFWLPEVDDEVLVAFEQGDIRRPFILGSLWNGVDKPTYDNHAQQGKNNYDTFLTRSGHCLQFVNNGEKGEERVVIQTTIKADQCTTDHKSRDGHFIVLRKDKSAETIEIYDRIQKNYILIDSKNNTITMESKDGDINILAGKNITMKAGKDFLIEAASNGKVKTGSNYDMDCGSAATQKSSSNHTIKGSKVLIN